MIKEEPTELKIFFDQPKTFELQNIKPLMGGLAGLYFIFSEKNACSISFQKITITLHWNE